MFNKICKHCKKNYTTNTSNQNFCSKECMFKSKPLIVNGDCLEWGGSKYKTGYGYFKFKGVKHKAYRVSCELAHGKPKDKDFALHSCDNPSCVNPDHLRWGSHQENMDDRSERKRYSNQKTNAKLTEDIVKEIKKELQNPRPNLYKELSEKYNVTTSSICHIKTGKTWKDVE